MEYKRNFFKLFVILLTIGFLFYFYNNTDNNAKSKNSTYVSTGTRVHFIDVGQGDCTLVESNGEYMLIDGGEGDYKENVMEYLDKLNVEDIKYLIATHPHSDHIGSLKYIIMNYDIDNIIMPKLSHTTPVYADFVGAVSDKAIKAYEPKVGDNYNFGDCSFTVLGPAKYDDKNINNNSVAIKLIHGNDKFIFGGDAEKSEENDIIASGIDLDVDLYKVNHHGSSTSSSKDFVESISPKYAVISCGKNNEYGHPNISVIDTLKSLNCKIYRTDESGDIVVESTGSRLKVVKGVLSESEISAG